MRACLLSLSILLASLLPGLAAEPLAGHVFIVSFDQGAPAGIAKADMPNLKRMAAEGAHTWEAQTVVPSVTLPSHTSMLTGVGIKTHQIIWNEFDPAKGTLKVPTIFKLARERGLVTALFSSKTKLKTLDQPGSLDAYVMPEDISSLGIARAFAAEVGRLKPNLALIHFGEPDAVGHKFGSWSPEKMKALADADLALGILLDSVQAAGFADSTVWILTADHGCHDVPAKGQNPNLPPDKIRMVATHGTDSPDDIIIPWIAWGAHVKPAFTITSPVFQYSTASTALWLLGLPVPPTFEAGPVTSAFD